MALQIILSLFIIAITIIIHGLGTAYWLKYLIKQHNVIGKVYGFSKSMKILSFTAIFLMLLHFMEIMLWAMVYMMIPQLDTLGHWEEAIYFSMVTYTTLGYGDITLAPVWRVMSGFEAMNGILLFGWSTAMFYAVVQKIILLSIQNVEVKKQADTNSK